MANKADLELLLKEQIQNPSRRRLLRNISVLLLGLASGCAPTLANQFGSKIEDKDKFDAKFYNRAHGAKREYAQVQTGKNPPWPANFRQHQSRTGLGAGGASGIDYYASLETGVASPAKGIMYSSTARSVPGIIISVYHGLGYITNCGHVRERFARAYEDVPRGAIIGAGGSAGTGGEVYPHIHLTTFGPVYTPYLKNVTLEPWLNEKHPWQYVIDGEQFSIDNSGQLPYVHQGDFKLDDIFWGVHEDAVKYCDDVLKGLATKESLAMMERTDSEKRVGVNHGVDVRLLYLYELINTGKSPLSRNENDKIKAKLIEYMTTTPALTAPIKDDSKPELYKILRKEPLYTWDMWLQGKR